MHQSRIARGYRYNPAISALNQAILTFVDNIESKIKISIIDSYSSIKPRLGFNEDNEVACLDHYNCRVNYGSNTASAMVWTPGGKAVFDAILHAMTG